MSDEGECAGPLALLRDPDMLENLVNDIGEGGVVGQAGNLVVLICAFGSRLARVPLNLFAQGLPGTGKSFLIAAVCRCFEDATTVLAYGSKKSVIHDTSLAIKVGDNEYLIDLTGKVIVFLEAKPSRALLEFLKPVRSRDQPEATYKVTESLKGGHATKTVKVRGWPVIVATGVTQPSGEEQTTRDLSITPFFSPELARAVNIEAARRSAGPSKHSGQSAVGARPDLWNAALCHRLVQMPVVNLFGEEMAKGFVAKRERSMRDFKMLLSCMESFALLHQHQRVVVTTSTGTRYLLAGVDDLRLTAAVAALVMKATTVGVSADTLRLYDECIGPLCRLEKSEAEIIQACIRHTGAPMPRSTFKEHHLGPLVESGLLDAYTKFKTYYYKANADLYPQAQVLLDPQKIADGSRLRTCRHSSNLSKCRR
jgi:hypothetical protein